MSANRTMKTLAVTFAGLLFLTALVGCGGTRQVSRVSPDQTIDLTGKWNDSDSKRVSGKMISELLNRPWLQNFKDEEGRKPRVVAGQFRNKSSEHIDMETWTKDIERELINAGQVSFVAMEEERSATRDERRDQARFATSESAAKMAQEKGADFMLSGYMNSQIQRADGQEVRAYEVHMQLIDIQTQEKVWIGSKEIKKRVQQSSYSW
ncbi:MAG: penicillin-binding protein activator LpoB [bacterium]